MLPANALTPELLGLHAALDVTGLWLAIRTLFERATAHHFVVVGLRSERCRPTTILRSVVADPSREWYEENLAEHPGFAYLREHPGTQVIRVSDIMPTSEVVKSDYYRRFMEPDGWLHSLAFFFWHGEELHAMVAANRSAQQGDFDEQDVAN